MDITDFGRVLNAMVDRVVSICDSHSSPATVMVIALRAGAAKCAEIAKEQLNDEPQLPKGFNRVNHGYSPTLAPGSYVEVFNRDGKSRVYPVEIVDWDNAFNIGWRKVSRSEYKYDQNVLEPEWIKHDKICAPFAPMVYVEVKLSNGSIISDYVKNFIWDYSSLDPARIIAYRVIDKPEQTD